MSSLVVTIAPPGAGKSTWLAARFAPTQVVNLDMLRALVSDNPGDQGATTDAAELQHMLLSVRCRRRLLTAVDATNLRVEHRTGLVEHAHRNLMLPVAVVFDVPLEVCLARNATRVGPTRVPDGRLVEMHEQFVKTIPPDGPVDWFAVTRRVRLDGDLVYGQVGPQHRGEAWLL